MFKGSIVALVTPMKKGGAIDYDALHNLIEWHLDSGTDGFVIAGTTGESATLTLEERYDLVSKAVKQVAKRVPVIAGTGTASTHHTIELTHQAQTAGADAVLIVTPYAIKPSQNGLYEHYKLIAEKTALPIILYNVPGRTACDLLPETAERLSKIKSIMGIKEATGKLDRAIEIAERCGKDFAIYSGEDPSSKDLLLNGAQGVISVTSNVAPRKMHDFCKAALDNEKALAEKLNTELMPLHKKLFLETNPVPTKWALHKMGLIPEGIRLPLLPLDAKYHAELEEALLKTGTLHT